ncbi:zinc ribbon domain-containing protein [Sandaracinus amylolyticus]|uniref:Uncharacterized protein n=1 Tax=Sandaracinus amylolyticus TaxID=927083 RepID=A0A0F6YH69_9BACT|nr:zinc ribbon domain-containing protein [Sandaracinus amylolyticus]AKF05563.1 hypothetical protein DB32_002712 [Sandaracinus amylolyticus]
MSVGERRGWVALVAAVVIASAASSARADGPYEGDWRAGPMRIDVQVESWGGDCGPRPESTTVPGGSTVHVTQSGDDLTFQGRPARSTRGCWSENASVRRVSSSFQAGTWRIVCRTPDDDPRAETGQYTLRAEGTERIEFRDVSRYDWQLNESSCRATITSTQTFERVGGASPTPEPEPMPTPTPEPEREPACTPGAPARISLRPAQSTLEPGGRVCLSARVVDANGCAIRGRSPRLELRTPPGATGQLRGTCFEAAASAAEGEGEFTIVARDGAMEAQVRVQVRTPDLSDLIARRAEGGGAVTLGDAESTSEEAARVAARSEGAARGTPAWLVAGAVLGLVMVVVASIGLVVVGRRRRKKKERPIVASEVHEAPVAPVPAPVPPPPPVASGEPKICPTCRRGYPPDATTCSVDGTPLVAYADFAAGKAASTAASEKICPVCGTRYPASTRFCGKDGTTLS